MLVLWDARSLTVNDSMQEEAVVENPVGEMVDAMEDVAAGVIFRRLITVDVVPTQLLVEEQQTMMKQTLPPAASAP